MATNKDIQRRLRRKRSIRRKIVGSAERPRLSVFRSNKGIYAQLIDDVAGATLASVSVKDVETAGAKVEVSKAVGQELAKRALAKGVETVVFDRNGYLYHGRVKALAEGAREGGLKF